MAKPFTYRVFVARDWTPVGWTFQGYKETPQQIEQRMNWDSFRPNQPTNIYHAGNSTNGKEFIDANTHRFAIGVTLGVAKRLSNGRGYRVVYAVMT